MKIPKEETDRMGCAELRNGYDAGILTLKQYEILSKQLIDYDHEYTFEFLINYCAVCGKVAP